jgi:hypothetical protein
MRPAGLHHGSIELAPEESVDLPPRMMAVLSLPV